MQADTALVIIDMQMVMQERIDAGRPHVNPNAPAAVEALAKAFRQAGRPVIHIRHAEADPASPLYPDASGYPPMACAQALPGEALFVKRSSSAFATTPLAAHLRDQVCRTFMSWTPWPGSVSTRRCDPPPISVLS